MQGWCAGYVQGLCRKLAVAGGVGAVVVWPRQGRVLRGGREPCRLALHVGVQALAREEEDHVGLGVGPEASWHWVWPAYLGAGLGSLATVVGCC